MAIVADTIAKLPGWQVTIAGPDDDVREEILRLFQLDLSGVEYVRIPRGTELTSAGVDLFCCLTNYYRITPAGKVNILFLQVPFSSFPIRFWHR